MYGYVYKITDKRNQKYYIGKHKSSEIDESYWGSGLIISNIKNTHGTSVLSREILQKCDSLDELNNAEKYWILELNSRDKSLGYNLTPGGDGGDTVSDYNWYTDGIEDFYVRSDTLDTIPCNWQKGRTNKSKKPKGGIWVNNGIVQAVISKDKYGEYEKIGYTKGMLPRSDEWVSNIYNYQHNRPASHNENIRKSRKKFFEDHPNFRNSGNWVKGQESPTKNKKCITNGVENHFIYAEDFPLWESKGWNWGITTRKHKKVEK